MLCCFGFWITESSCSMHTRSENPPQSKGRADEVMKLPGAVLGRGIEINMVMRVPLVNMGTDEKLVLAFCPAHGCFIADFVCLLRRDLAGRERLPDLKEQGPALHGPARFRLVLAFRQKKPAADDGSQR